MILVKSKAKYRNRKLLGGHKSSHNDSGHKHSDRLKRESGHTKAFRRELEAEKQRQREMPRKVRVLLPSGKVRMRQEEK